MNKAKEIGAQRHALSSPDTTAILQGFFKTGPGQYGAGDVFLGINIPPLRALAQKHRDANLATVAALPSSKYHEERMFALLLLSSSIRRSTRQASRPPPGT